MRKIKISEEQYKKALDEGVTLTADVDAANGDVAKAVETTKQQARKSGVDVSRAKIEIPAANESKVKTMKELSEEYFRNLKENADYFTVSDFIKDYKLGK